MPTFMETGITWLGGQLKQHAGTVCVYRRGADVIDVTLTRKRTDATTDRNSLLNDRELALRTSDFIALASDLVIGGVLTTPQAGDEIEWTDADETPRVSVAFPLVGEHAWRWHGGSRKLVRILTVDAESFVQLGIRAQDNEFTVNGILSRVTGREVFTDVNQISKYSQLVAYIDRAQFEAQGISYMPLWISVTVLGQVGWSVNFSESAWGKEVVKLGLDREELSREFQARKRSQI